MSLFILILALGISFGAFAMKTERDVVAWSFAGAWSAVVIALLVQLNGAADPGPHMFGSIGLLVAIFGAVINGLGAESRGRDVATYVLYGALFPLPTFIALVIRGRAVPAVAPQTFAMAAA